jgi:fumarate reductase subunit D
LFEATRETQAPQAIAAAFLTTLGRAATAAEAVAAAISQDIFFNHNQQKDLIMQNPYESPQADLSIPEEQSDRLDIFERFSTWYVFGLALVTMNLYIFYWLYSRTRTLNRLKGISPIGDTFILSTIIINIVSLLLSLGGVIIKNSSEYVLMSNITSIIAGILVLVWVFKFRHRLNDFLEQHQLPHRKAGPVFTFLFQTLHLSYKINENLELLEMASIEQGRSNEEKLETADATTG